MKLFWTPLLSIAAFSVLSSIGCARRSTDDASDLQARTQPIAGATTEAVDHGCPHQEDGTCGDATNSNKEPAASDQPTLYGQALGDSPLVELSQLLAAPESFHEKKVRVAGYINRVCTKRGCWMQLATNDQPEAPGCRVTFKDYGFLVPVDSKGDSVKLEGLVQLTEVKKKAVDHYEAEGAVFDKKDKSGNAHEIRLVATGVEITKS